MAEAANAFKRIRQLREPNYEAFFEAQRRGTSGIPGSARLRNVDHIIRSRNRKEIPFIPRVVQTSLKAITDDAEKTGGEILQAKLKGDVIDQFGEGKPVVMARKRRRSRAPKRKYKRTRKGSKVTHRRARRGRKSRRGPCKSIFVKV